MDEQNPRIVITFSGNDASLELVNVTPFQVMGAAALLRAEGDMHYGMQRSLAMRAQQEQGLTLAREIPNLNKRHI